MATLINLLPHLRWVALALLVFAVVSGGICGFYIRRARTGAYYMLRERARKKGYRWLLVSIGTLVAGLILGFFSRPPDFLVRLAPASPTPTAMPTATLEPLDTSTPSPTATATRRPTATPPFIPTSTPLPTATPPYTLPVSALTPQPSAVPAGPEAHIAFRTFALGEENGQPVEPGGTFDPGDHRVYFFFEYRGMAPNVVWSYGWYREGVYLDGATRLWALDAAGTNFLYFKPPGGYTTGTYDVAVWIEDVYQGAAQFVIAE
ncbi:MAG: hypothetical protein JXD18_10245 [Anaerolineae bacterium]|nr:hypothetical protein [Anaerolineae bacterium]